MVFAKARGLQGLLEVAQKFFEGDKADLGRVVATPTIASVRQLFHYLLSVIIKASLKSALREMHMPKLPYLQLFGEGRHIYGFTFLD